MKMKEIDDFDKELINRLNMFRVKLKNGDATSQKEINTICKELNSLKNRFCSNEKD